MNFGPPELIIILVIVLLLFGAKKLPELASSMGRSIREFRKGAAEGDGQAAGEGADSAEPAERAPDTTPS